jgi:hypothetical protein
MAEPIAQQTQPSSRAPVSIPLIAGPTPTAAGEDYLHELRVRIPVDLHRQLLSLKVLRGKSLAETVSTALDIYFAEHARRASGGGESSDP